MSIKQMFSPLVNDIADDIIIHSMLDQKFDNHVPDKGYLKEQLSQLIIDSIETYCDTIKEKK